MAIYTRADNVASSQGFEPQRQYNWQLELGLDGEGNDIILSVVDGFLPTRVQNPMIIPYANTQVKAPGRMVWESGDITLRDWVDRHTLKLLLDWQVECGNPQTGAIGLCASVKRDCSIIQYPPDTADGTGVEVVSEKVWTLKGCWPSMINPAMNGLSMTADGQVLIGMRLEYDLAIASGSKLNVNYNPVPRLSIVAPVI